jgi:hypothetical protein
MEVCYCFWAVSRTRERKVRQVELRPNGTTAIDIDGYGGPASSQFRYCVQVTGAEIVP